MSKIDKLIVNLILNPQDVKCAVCKQVVRGDYAIEMSNLSDTPIRLYSKNFKPMDNIPAESKILTHRKCAASTQTELYILNLSNLKSQS